MSAQSALYPHRGEIWWTRFPVDPPDKGRRPVIVVSKDGRNQHPRANTVLVVPLSTSIHLLSPTHLVLRTRETGLREDSIAKAEEVCTVRRSELDAPVAGHRALSHSQICRIAEMVRLAMDCAV